MLNRDDFFQDIKREKYMKDLKKLSEECISELRQLGIQPGMIKRWYVETNTTRRWGVCKKERNSREFEIGISASLLEDYVDDIPVKNTIIHELLHTVDGCSGHTGKWKMLAQKVNAVFPEYDIKRLSSEDEKGVHKDHRYMLECTECGAKIYRDRMSNAIKFPEKYKCAVCKGTLKRVY